MDLIMSNGKFDKDSVFGDNVIKRYLDDLEDLPLEHADVGVVVKDGDVGITGSVNKDIGKPGGWKFAAEGSWMHKAGKSVKALLTWKKNEP